MNNVTFYNSEINDNEKLYLHFTLGDNKYAVSVQNVVEIMKLPMLEYPQKLPANVIGLLNYNNFTINVLDLRFYLNMKVPQYSTSNQLLIVKTDETIFGLLIDKVKDIISLETSKIEYFQFQKDAKVIEFLYKEKNETISIVDLYALENIIKEGTTFSDIDIPSLFPTDDDSRYTLMERSLALAEKTEQNMVANVFSQNKFTCFSLDDTTYCMNLEYVREFLKNSTITPIPCDLDYIEGVITLRGDFVTVIDTKKFLGINSSAIKFKDVKNAESSSEESKNHVIITETPDFKIGLMVDKIFGIFEIPEEMIKENYQDQNKYISSEVIMDGKLFVILNMKNILSDERFYIEDGN